VRELGQRGIIVHSPSPRGVAEEAPGAYKDVTAVVDAAHAAGLSRKVARSSRLSASRGNQQVLWGPILGYVAGFIRIRNVFDLFFLLGPPPEAVPRAAHASSGL